jgi:ElaB/YqjD/DUF883 family membrane-anchored ribosome-binding protein
VKSFLEVKRMPEMNESRSAASNLVRNAARSAHEAVDEVTRAAAPAIEKAATGIHGAVDAAAGAASPAAQWLDEKTDRVLRSEKRLRQNAGEYVRTHPLSALVGAFALGFLLGKLTD